MREIKSIEDIEQFEILNRKLYAIKPNKLIIFNAFFKIIEEKLIDTLCLKIFDNNVLLQPNEKEKVKIINCKNKQIDDVILMNSFIDKDSLYILNSNRNISKFDKNFNIVQEYKGIGRFPKLFIDKYYIKLSYNSIICYELKTNKLCWQHNSSVFLKGENVYQYGDVIVYEGILYVYLADHNNHNNKATLAIDINTGEIKNIFKDFAGYLTLYNYKIATVRGQKVQILNTKNQRIITKDYSNLLSDTNLEFSWNRFKISEDELLYFIANDHRQGSHIGIIDLKTDELLWLYNLNPNKDTYDIAVLDFKFSDNRLFVHCSDNSLYIFEQD